MSKKGLKYTQEFKEEAIKLIISCLVEVKNPK